MLSTYKISCYCSILLLCFSCLEPYDIKTETFESALVIEATITDEVKPQTILLSRSYRFEDDAPNPEVGANVSITDDNNQVFAFYESSPGEYVSNSAFSAAPSNEYTLHISTSDGRSYSSEPTALTGTSNIDNLEAIRQFNEEGNEEVAIVLDTYDPSNSSIYYRYVYEETYKIIAPNWSPYEAIIDTSASLGVTTILRDEQINICFNTVRSNNVIITDTKGLSEDRLNQFPIRTISTDNYIISHRYSIQVKQYVQSLDAYTYYETLEEFSGSESIFSENQPGFFNGNVFSLSNSSEKVIGFFDVSSVDTKRIYFNYEDLFPGEFLPPYAEDCIFFYPELYFYDGAPVSPLRSSIVGETLIFFDENPNPDTGVGYAPYIMVFPPCGDCTELGSTEVPTFWED